VSADTDTATLTPPVSEKDHAEGPKNAPVTLVEYGDYECPHCGRAHPVLKEIQKEMGTQLRFVFRNFPLREAHPHALHAALAAEAAGVHGEREFWRMHDTIYEHQDALDDADLMAYGEACGVNPTEIERAFEGGDLTARVRADFRGGIRSGVNGTPTFFINGERYDDDWTDVPSFLSTLRAAAKGGA
jgi:protein-disulfide isomerase